MIGERVLEPVFLTQRCNYCLLLKLRFPWLFAVMSYFPHGKSTNFGIYREYV